MGDDDYGDHDDDDGDGDHDDDGGDGDGDHDDDGDHRSRAVDFTLMIHRLLLNHRSVQLRYPYHRSLVAGAEEFVPAHTEVLLPMLLCVSALVAGAY